MAAATAGGGLSGAELAAELVEEGLASLRAGRAVAATQLGDADRLLRQVCSCPGRGISEQSGFLAVFLLVRSSGVFCVCGSFRNIVFSKESFFLFI